MISLALRAAGLLLTLLERAVNRPAKPAVRTFPHDGVSDAEIDAALKRAQKLEPQ